MRFHVPSPLEYNKLIFVSELHLNEYSDRKLEYLRAIKTRLTNVLIPAKLCPFSAPTDEAGYNESIYQSSKSKSELAQVKVASA